MHTHEHGMIVLCSNAQPTFAACGKQNRGNVSVG